MRGSKEEGNKQANQILKDVTAQRLKEDKAREALLVETARNSERSPHPTSVHRSKLNAPSARASQKKRKQPQSNDDASDAELVVTETQGAKEKITAKNSKKPVVPKKRTGFVTEEKETCVKGGQ